MFSSSRVAAGLFVRFPAAACADENRHDLSGRGKIDHSAWGPELVSGRGKDSTPIAFLKALVSPMSPGPCAAAQWTEDVLSKPEGSAMLPCLWAVQRPAKSTEAWRMRVCVGKAQRRIMDPLCDVEPVVHA